MKGSISNPECNVLSIDPDYNNGTRRSIYFDLINPDQNVLYLDNGVEFANIVQSGKNGIPVNVFNVSNEYIRDNDLFGMSGDVRKGNHLSYFPDQGIFATLFMGPEIFDELYSDIKQKIIPKNFGFEFFKYGFSNPCLFQDNDRNAIIWDVRNVKILNVWGISFSY